MKTLQKFHPNRARIRVSTSSQVLTAEKKTLSTFSIPEGEQEGKALKDQRVAALPTIIPLDPSIRSG
jgi:hypothetical protein